MKQNQQKQSTLQQLWGQERIVRKKLDIQIARESNHKLYVKDGTTLQDITEEDYNYSDIRNRITNEEYNDATDVKEHQCAASAALQQIRTKLYHDASKNGGLFRCDGRFTGTICYDKYKEVEAERNEWEKPCGKDDEPVISETPCVECTQDVIDDYIKDNLYMNQDIQQNLQNSMKPSASTQQEPQQPSQQTSCWDSLPNISVGNVLSQIGEKVFECASSANAAVSNFSFNSLSFDSLNLNCCNASTVDHNNELNFEDTSNTSRGR